MVAVSLKNCLRYEQEAYEDLVKHVPKNGAFVETTEGYGSVTLVNLLRQRVKVRLDGQGEDNVKTFEADQVAEVPGGRPPEGEPLPHVLHYVPKPPEEPEEDEWAIPQMLPEDYEGPKRADETPAGAEPERKSAQRRHRRGKAVPKEAPVRTDKPDKTDKSAPAPKTQRKGGAPNSAAEGERIPNVRKNHRPHRRSGRGKTGGTGEKHTEA